MKNKEVKGILALVVVTALSFGVIIGSKSLALSAGGDASGESSETLEEFDVSGAENIEKAGKTADGYLVTVRTKGYVGDIVMDVAFDSSASKITEVKVVEQSETDGLGSKITEPEFLDQFKGAEAPVFLPGMDVSAGSQDSSSEAEAAKPETDLSGLEGAEFTDGTYEAKTSEPDSNGFIDVVSLTVKDGKITEVNWDAVTEDGSKKSIMSENGEYTMTEDGPTWKEQSESLAKALIENQSLSFLTTDAEGKTDAVSGVSISVSSFIDLAAQCMEQAAGLEQAQEDPFAGAELTDGTYEAKTSEPDSNGFTGVVTLTVKDGKITEANWDAVTEDGSKKSIMSENGEYTMTEDGPTWKAQAEALAKALIENQSLSFLTTDAEGKTDAVTGVSISVNGFIDLATQCLEQASGIEVAEPEATEAPAEEEAPASAEGTQIDAVSGATKSSTAAVNGINDAYNFLQTVK